MKILNSGNQYLVLQSEEIKAVTQSPSDYTSVKITGKINCCPESVSKDILINSVGWFSDISDSVESKSILTNIKFRNKISMELYSIPVNIDLGYVHNTCPNLTCTLETFQDFFAPLFKEAIDTWFSDKDIESDISVSFSGNIVSFDNLPENFHPYSLVVDELDNIFNFAEVDSGIFFNGDSLYINPSFFDLGAYKNGIYSIEVTILKENNSYSIDKNCFFMDIDLKCKVAETLKNITDVSTTTSTNLHLMHYALVNGSNCACSCEDLCKLYKEFVTMLSKADPKIQEDCDCN